MATYCPYRLHPQPLLLAWVVVAFLLRPVTPSAAPVSIGCVLSPVQPEICGHFEEVLQNAPWNTTFQPMDEIEILDAVKSLHFALVDPKTLACLDVEYGIAPIATLGVPNIYVPKRKTHDDFVFEVGAVIFTRADSTVESLEHLKDRVVATTTTTDLASTNAAFVEYRQRTGSDLIDDAATIEFMGTPARVLGAVLSGTADVGIVQAGFLEQAVKDRAVTWEDVLLLSLNVVESNHRMFPYHISTVAYPGWALVGFEATTTTEREQMLDFLFNTSVDLSVHFALAESYATAGDALETFGIIERDLTRSANAYCPRTASHRAVLSPANPGNAATDTSSSPPASSFSSVWTAALIDKFDPALQAPRIICPQSHFRHSKYIQETLCVGLDCPNNTLCACQACQESPPVLVHSTLADSSETLFSSSVDTLQNVLLSSCERMRVCSTVQQGTPQFMLVEDKYAQYRPNEHSLFFFIRVDWSEAGISTTTATPLPHDHQFAIFNVTTPHFGRAAVEIYVADPETTMDKWEPIYASPFLLEVTPRDCPPGQEATQDNTCVCPVGTLHISGSCMQAKEYLPIFIGSALAVIGIGVYIAIAMVRRGADKLWQIDAADVVVSDPPEVLGMGAFGVVIKGELNGTAIAIKRVMPRASRAGARGTRTGSKRGFLSSMKRSSKNGECDDALAAPDGTVTGTYQASRTANGFGLQLGNMDNEAAIERALEQGNATTQGTTHRMSKTKRLTNAKAEFMEEMRLLSRLRHPCIATMLGAIMTKSREFLLVMEHLEHGSLYDFLRNDELPTPDMFLLPIVKDIVSGMRYIHNLKPPVVHGDLKTKNVLVDGNFKAKVADFGLSQKQRFGCGTPFWMAPEVLRGGEVTREADVYSFAITVYEIYSRHDPFPEEDASECCCQIAAAQVRQSDPTFPGSGASWTRSWASSTSAKVGASLIQQKQDALKKATVLHDVFPPHIAKMLEEGKKVHPEHKDDVTIFFSDIVGFTNISAQLTPAAVSDMLDRLYSAFDELTEKHGVFKVETIGDAYMAATNLVKPQHDHALRIAQFAEDAIKAAQSTFIDPERPELGCVNIRVGFHCGPVVANVVGRRNPRYCLFGDTVNTASRMESSSERNKIHVSTSAGDRVRSQAPWVKLESRGVQNIKGKGEMLTYWLVSTRKPEQTGRVAIAENEATVIDMGEGDGDVDGDDDGDGDTGSRRKSAQLKDSVGGGFVFKKKRASSIGRRSTGTHESRASARVSLSSVSWLNDAKAFEALSRDSFGSRRASTTACNLPTTTSLPTALSTAVTVAGIDSTCCTNSDENSIDLNTSVANAYVTVESSVHDGQSLDSSNQATKVLATVVLPDGVYA
ncbi:TKL/DICTY4/DRK protein kinase [Salpingoeca rosetta]|uniref:guanylate cyclase n=1 Tax=Salpingoeca rosetta (strain ATCC 50818 / BSB-021) TaxID=946362 RepID=F2UGJ0_SALR5|nr:TKL/DICTY4/DRK protein kinase [Salpingoeca rosetta]EGD75740.1 TKL/DICTY4/DRK protein kinase [Salpingoeca rosetta]|eukprot:XP_004991661.1 TKL/DICTY4/DRK protein kinase [Salpingoeca rosetta]